jgi:hypothetical protein
MPGQPGKAELAWATAWRIDDINCSGLPQLRYATIELYYLVKYFILLRFTTAETKLLFNSWCLDSSSHDLNDGFQSRTQRKWLGRS